MVLNHSTIKMPNNKQIRQIKDAILNVAKPIAHAVDNVNSSITNEIKQDMRSLKNQVNKNSNLNNNNNKLRNKNNNNNNNSRRQRKRGSAFMAGQTAIFKNRELVFNVYGGTNFSVQSIPIGCNNPQLSWLYGISQNFETYRIKHIQFEYQPLASQIVTSGSLGDVMMVINYDPGDPQFYDIPTMGKYFNCVSFNPTQRRIEKLKINQKITPIPTKFVEHDSFASALNDYGVFYIANEGTQSGLIGQLWAEYSIEVSIPRPRLSNPDQILGFTGVVNSSNTYDWCDGDMTTTVTTAGPNYAFISTLPASGSNIGFNVPGYYRVEFMFYAQVPGGFTGAVAVIPGTFTYSNCAAITSSSGAIPDPYYNFAKTNNVTTANVPGASTSAFMTAVTYVDAFHGFVPPSSYTYASTSSFGVAQTYVTFTGGLTWSSSSGVVNGTVNVTYLNSKYGAPVQAPTIHSNKDNKLLQKLLELETKMEKLSEKQKEEEEQSPTYSILKIEPPNTPITLHEKYPRRYPINDNNNNSSVAVKTIK